MFVKLRNTYYNLNNFSSFEILDTRIVIYYNFANSEGEVVTETIYFDEEKEDRKMKKDLIRAAKRINYEK